MGAGLKKVSAIENEIADAQLSADAISSIDGTAPASVANSQGVSFKSKSIRSNSEIIRAGNEALAAQDWPMRCQRAFFVSPSI